MALGRAGGSERKRAAHNSALLARATRRTRALRLEHDPQPGLNGCTVRRRRGFFTTDGFGLAGKPPYPDVLKGLGSFLSQRRSALATWPRAARNVRSLEERAFRGRRMPERGKSRFATVSSTYIRPGEADGKQRGIPPWVCPNATGTRPLASRRFPGRGGPAHRRILRPPPSRPTRPPLRKATVRKRPNRPPDAWPDRPD